MKIQNEGLQGSAPLETNRTQPAAPGTTNRVGGQTITATGGDSVEISGISSHLAETNAADGQQRESRVAELAAQYARGEYHVDAAKLSNAMVSHALGTGASGEK